MICERSFVNQVASVGEARRYVLEALDGLAPPDCETVAVLVSELAANAVRHTESGFTVTVERLEALVRVAVGDDSPSRPKVRVPGPAEPSGRGMQIVPRAGRTRKSRLVHRCGAARKAYDPTV